MNEPLHLLIEATRKLMALSAIPDWKNELLDKAPPVLWFGDANSEKPKILSFGANPSRWEFLDERGIKKAELKKHEYESRYLNPGRRRFVHLDELQQWNDLLLDYPLREQILDSFNNYFKSGNAYRWFGTNKNDSYNAEGVLRGMEASYFDIDSCYRAMHIDLFPFATIRDFGSIRQITERDVLQGFWARDLVNNIISLLKPKKLLLFGAGNLQYFCNYFGVDAGTASEWKAKENGALGICRTYRFHYSGIPVSGLSVNLGNPKGFNAKGLRELGAFLYCDLI
jgi:hypothetical protein